MKTFVTNVLTFIGVLAVLVAIRAGDVGTAVTEAWQGGFDYSEKEWAEGYTKDQLDGYEEQMENARHSVESQLSGQCSKRAVCNDNDVEIIMDAVVDAANTHLTGGWVSEELISGFMWYAPDSRSLVVDYEMNAEWTMKDTSQDLLDHLMAEDVCGDPDMTTAMKVFDITVVWRYFENGTDTDPTVTSLTMEGCS